jgi:2-oxo-4-hydroxy-4-carboxy-5-ureidoimidazoline decarboxylase
MSDVLGHWNQATTAHAESEILPCCGSSAWARGMVAHRPLADEESVLAASDETWRSLSESDWMEAFRSHPRIGESRAPESAHARSAAWSTEEQKNAAAEGEVKIALMEANREYERRFGRVFIVCATGKTALEILKILQARMPNDDRAEIHEAAEQQRQITQIRLRKWLRG